VYTVLYTQQQVYLLLCVQYYTVLYTTVYTAIGIPILYNPILMMDSKPVQNKFGK